jgi:CRP-like cAMP-binding protein
MAPMPRPTAKELQAFSLFASVSTSDRELLAAGLEVVEVAPGTVVIPEGAPNRSLYVVREGELDVSVGGEYRQTLRPGAFFGEISLEKGAQTTASVAAKTQATLYMLSEAAYRSLLANQAAVLRIKAAMGDRQAADRLFKLS